MSKLLRPYLKITGERLVDIDFSACHIEILYREIVEPAPKNPYIYDEADERRGYAKKLLLTTLNLKKNPTRTVKQVRNDVVRASRIHEDDAILKEILIKLENKHNPIKQYFYTGRGLKLQLAEAKIMRKIMKLCIKNKIPILPVHDGCSVRISDADKVEDIFKKVTDMPFSRDELIRDTDKIKTRIEKWIKYIAIDPRLEEITAKFNKILKKL